MTETIAVEPVPPEILKTENPATGEVIAEWPVDDAAAVHAAVAAARAAAPHWADLGFGGRKKALLRWNAHLITHAEEFCELIHAENGKPVDDAYLEVVTAAEHLHWAARNARKALAPQKVWPGAMMANHEAVIEHHPLGVVGVIGPWNYPVFTPNGSIAYALAAGNTVVFKPSEYTVSVGHWYVDAFAKANPELPPGILTAITGYGETGAALVAADVDKIAFTGSTPTGKRIMAAAAARLTPVLLECGGKDAAIVAEDADLAAAADGIVWSAMSNSGQTCVGAERCYVVESVLDEFLAEVRKVLRTVNPGAHAGASYGPMTMPAQVDIVVSHIDDALAGGGSAFYGGPESVRAPFIDPVVLVGVSEDSAAVREETFGPTLTVRAVKNIDEAVELANNSRYGLASSVFSRKHGMQIARRLEAGATSVNAPAAYAAIPALPFGGVGESGIGRIHGEQGLRAFTRTHAIARQRFSIPGMALQSFGRTAGAMRLTRTVAAAKYGRAT